MNKHECPVCYYPDMDYPAQDYHICPCCGTEFGNNDADATHEQLRNSWIDSGCNWWYGDPPDGWNGELQILLKVFEGSRWVK